MKTGKLRQIFEKIRETEKHRILRKIEISELRLFLLFWDLRFSKNRLKFWVEVLRFSGIRPKIESRITETLRKKQYRWRILMESSLPSLSSILFELKLSISKKYTYSYF